jgi:hypothetical protein
MASSKATPKKRRVSFKGARQKGTRAETEFVEIMRSLGIPSQRVLASGSFVGAKADVKVGVRLNRDNTYPAPDESASIMRVEVKNQATNPEVPFSVINAIPTQGMVFAPTPKDAPALYWKYLNQDAVSKAVILRRAKVPSNAVASKDWNQVFMVAMGLDDFAKLFKKAYGHELGSE